MKTRNSNCLVAELWWKCQRVPGVRVVVEEERMAVNEVMIASSAVNLVIGLETALKGMVNTTT